MSGVRELNLNKYLVQTSTIHGNPLHIVKKHHRQHVKHDHEEKEAKQVIKEARVQKYHPMFHVQDNLCN
jgi:hypothetical protein